MSHSGSKNPTTFAHLWGLPVLCFAAGISVSADAELVPFPPNTVQPEVIESEGVLSDGEYLLVFSDGSTATVERRIREGASQCERLPWVYRHDCLAETFRSAARLNRNKPDYRDARAILGQAAKKLSTIVGQNIDTSAPKIKSGRKAFRPVDPARKVRVSKAGRAVVQEAEILLLRSGGIQKRQEHYRRIADAVASTELLLRASILFRGTRVAEAGMFSMPPQRPDRSCPLK